MERRNGGIFLNYIVQLDRGEPKKAIKYAMQHVHTHIEHTYIGHSVC